MNAECVHTLSRLVWKSYIVLKLKVARRGERN